MAEKEFGVSAVSAFLLNVEDWNEIFGGMEVATAERVLSLS